MRTIIEVKGEKKFKYKSSSIETMSKDDVLRAFSEGKDIDLNQTREIFRKSNLKSSYNTQFGAHQPKATEDFMILNTKKFRTLQLSKYIQPEAAYYIEKWL
jgi:hypothetical protein